MKPIKCDACGGRATKKVTTIPEYNTPTLESLDQPRERFVHWTCRNCGGDVTPPDQLHDRCCKQQGCLRCHGRGWVRLRQDDYSV